LEKDFLEERGLKPISCQKAPLEDVGSGTFTL
jgi:hypothetical protein